LLLLNVIGYYDTVGNIIQEASHCAFLVKDGMIILRTENLVALRV
jgi:hypothetical protein